MSRTLEEIRSTPATQTLDEIDNLFRDLVPWLQTLDSSEQKIRMQAAHERCVQRGDIEAAPPGSAGFPTSKGLHRVLRFVLEAKGEAVAENMARLLLPSLETKRRMRLYLYMIELQKDKTS